MNDNSVSNELQGHLRVDLAEPRAYQLLKVGLLSQRRVTSLWHLEHDDRWLIQTLLFSGCQCYPQFFTLDTILRNVDRWLLIPYSSLEGSRLQLWRSRWRSLNNLYKHQQRDNICINEFLKMEVISVWQVPLPRLKSNSCVWSHRPSVSAIVLIRA